MDNKTWVVKQEGVNYSKINCSKHDCTTLKKNINCLTKIAIEKLYLINQFCLQVWPNIGRFRNSEIRKFWFFSNILLTINKPNLTLPKLVTKIKNIKTKLTKILRPTHFSGMKDIKTDKISWSYSQIFFWIGVVGLNI